MCKLSEDVIWTFLYPAKNCFNFIPRHQFKSSLVTCDSEFLHPPEYILWEHNGSGVAGGTFHAPDNTTRGSTLRLEHITGAHGGNYSCVPARIHAQCVVLHVPDAAEKRLPYNGGPAAGGLSEPLASVLGAFLLIKMAAAALAC